MSSEEGPKKEVNIWHCVKALSTLALVAVLSCKIYETPINMTVDFPTLLSLLLALFSVGLAALFYFKATETSNTFYDNTYNFTKDIAQLLVKIESGFGERLRNLDEGYSAMRDHLQRSPYSNENFDETKEKIEGEKKEIEKVLEERNQILSTLIDRSQLQNEEKERVLEALAEKEKELELSQKELNRMNKRLFIERMKRRNSSENMDSGFEKYTYRNIIENIGLEKVNFLSSLGLKKRVDEILNEMPRGYIKDLEKRGYFDGGLTNNGVSFIKDLAETDL